MIDYNDLIGIPFQEDGDGKTGINCYELLRAVHKKHDIVPPKTNIAVCACKEVSNNTIKDGLAKNYEKIIKPEHPCFVLIKSSDPKFANHVASYIGNNKILHVSKNTNSTIERLLPKYQHRILGYYKFIGNKL